MKKTVRLRNEVELPRVGLGTYQMKEEEETVQAILNAIATGYRAIDTAKVYGNEQFVGQAIRASAVPREELFLTSKVWNDEQGYDETLRAFERSLTALQVDYLDAYLTHWPVEGKFVETFRAIERLYDEKLIRVPGVCNHHLHHLQALEKSGVMKPLVNQIEVHPLLTQEALRSYCKEQAIQVIAWSPLARGALAEEPTLTLLAKKYNRTIAQVILRWHLQTDSVVIPKSVQTQRIKENYALFDFELSLSDIGIISSLNQDERTGPDPDAFNF